MRLFHWTQSNAVFLPAIDEEHQEIYSIAGELQTALDAKAPVFHVREVLHRLIAATEDHFAHEEHLMRQSRYAAFGWHKQQHNTARRRMRDLAPFIEKGDTAAGETLLEFLSKWLHDHTSLTDRMMSAFLRNQQRAAVS
jgi:hemerythrin